jgi:hypothetical protein
MKFAALITLVSFAVASAEGGVRLLKDKKTNPAPNPGPTPVGNPSPVANPVPIAVPVPVGVPVPVPFPVAVPVPAVPTVPQNCCQFYQQLLALDSACSNAAQQGLLAFNLQTFANLQFTCEVTPQSIVALQSNLKAARANFVSYLAPILQKLTPITQVCFAQNVLLPLTFACDSRVINENTFAVSPAPKFANHINDYMCCSASGAPAPQPIHDAQVLLPLTVSSQITGSGAAFAGNANYCTDVGVGGGGVVAPEKQLFRFANCGL